MLRIRNIITKLSRKYVTEQTWRTCSTGVHLKKESVRESMWREAQEKYAQYPNVLYSSYVEAKYMESRRQEHYESKRRRNVLSYAQETSYSDVATENELSKFPKNWMEDYEYYSGTTDALDKMNSIHGTADPLIPPSRVPCNGCGAHLHCTNNTVPGYIPKEIFEGRSFKELQTIICQRCHFLKHYNIELDLEVSADTYIKTISRIKDEYALAIIMVDLLDFPCSIWPGMQELLGFKRPVIIVGNKVDLLPRDSKGYLDHVKACLRQQLIENGFKSLNIKYISLISAKTGYGIEELITQLHKIWLYKGNVYLMGCTNVGKSSLFNILLNSDYCRPGASDLVRKATTCPWPGTTLQVLKFPILRPSEIRIYQRFRRLSSERNKKVALEKLRQDQAHTTGNTQKAKLIGHVGRTFDNHLETLDAFSMSKGTSPIETLNERSKEFQQARWCFDTPGVMHPEQITNLLTANELKQLEPDEMIQPRAVRLLPGMSLFLAGLGRLDFIEIKQHQTQEPWIRAYVFSSKHLPIVITKTQHADEMYARFLGTAVLGLPHGDEQRLARWPGLQCNVEDLIVKAGVDENDLSCDIILSSAGWIGLSMAQDSKAVFKAWTPHARGIYKRTPAVIPHAKRLVGKHIRNSLAYNLSKPFVFRK